MPLMIAKQRLFGPVVPAGVLERKKRGLPAQNVSLYVWPSKLPLLYKFIRTQILSFEICIHF